MVDAVAPPSSPRIYDTLDSFAVEHGLEMNSVVNATYGSCGVSILSGLNSTHPKDVVNKILKERAPTDRKFIREAFVMFSDTDNRGTKGGNALCAYIKDNKLGNIVEFGPRMNPNTGNMIKLWIWTPPHESLHPEYKQMPVYGKVLVKNQYGSQYVDSSDARFVETRNAREM